MSGGGTVTIFVTYPGTASTRFDRDYYVVHHLPKLVRAWQPHGLESAQVFFPLSAPDGTISITQLRFRDDTAVADALTAPQTHDLVGDIPNFTDATPDVARAQPLLPT